MSIHQPEWKIRHQQSKVQSTYLWFSGQLLSTSCRASTKNSEEVTEIVSPLQARLFREQVDSPLTQFRTRLLSYCCLQCMEISRELFLLCWPHLRRGINGWDQILDIYANLNKIWWAWKFSTRFNDFASFSFSPCKSCLHFYLDLCANQCAIKQVCLLPLHLFTSIWQCTVLISDAHCCWWKWCLHGKSRLTLNLNGERQQLNIQHLCRLSGLSNFLWSMVLHYIMVQIDLPLSGMHSSLAKDVSIHERPQFVFFCIRELIYSSSHNSYATSNNLSGFWIHNTHQDFLGDILYTNVAPFKVIQSVCMIPFIGVSKFKSERFIAIQCYTILLSGRKTERNSNKCTATTIQVT